MTISRRPYSYSTLRRTKRIWIVPPLMARQSIMLSLIRTSAVSQCGVLSRPDRPLITLHGHVHESTRLTGSWRQQLGSTLCFSAAHDGPELALVRFVLRILRLRRGNCCSLKAQTLPTKFAAVRPEAIRSWFDRLTTNG